MSGSDITHYREFKTLRSMLDAQKKKEEKEKKRLEHIYGPDHQPTKDYQEEEFKRRKLEEKKKELRRLLGKYVQSGSQNELVAHQIRIAQNA